MKTLFQTLACTCLALALIGTTFGADEKMPMKDHIMMSHGKVMVVKSGKEMMMEKDMVLDNGTKVMTDGTVMMKDGKKMMLKNGHGIDMMGMEMKMPPKTGEETRKP